MNYINLKNKAIELRKKGLSYSEINNVVHVSKSTLSLWLRNIQLSTAHKNRLKRRIGKGQPLGALAQKRIREEKTKRIISTARGQVTSLSKKELFLIGTVMYWAEGTKQKGDNVSQRVTFNNSDPEMIRVFLKWLRKIVDIPRSDISFEVYSHENIRSRELKVISYWSKVTGYQRQYFDKIYYKKDKKKKYRYDQMRNYNGLLRICVKRSTDLNRRITGWTQGIIDQCGVV